MKKQLLMMAVLMLAAAPAHEAAAQRQIVMTMEQALAYSEEHNPDLINSRLSMERYEQNLIAQKASLKSRFSLNLQPLSYSQSRQLTAVILTGTPTVHCHHRVRSAYRNPSFGLMPRCLSTTACHGRTTSHP